MHYRFYTSAGLGFIFLIAGCHWDPPHDNPVDPNSPHYQEAGSLTVTVLTLNRQPIAGATVLIEELGRFELTGSDGRGLFEALPVGQWWVRAFREENTDTVYARDSILVSIRNLARTETELQLDALPFFTDVKVYSFTEAITDSTRLFKIRCKGRVNDPDGQADLTAVCWKLLDLVGDTMMYRADSAYWWSEMPSDSFPTGRLDDVLGLPFVFEARDEAGGYSLSEKAYLLRVIHETPSSIQIDNNQNPVKIEWNFKGEEFVERDSTQYNFLLRILNSEIPPAVIYEAKVAPQGYNHIIYWPEIKLELGRYYCEIYVIDQFGNISRSKQHEFLI